MGTLLAVGTTVGFTACSPKSEGAPAQVARATDAGPASDAAVADGRIAAATQAFLDARDRAIAALDARLIAVDAQIATLKIDLNARAAEGNAAATSAMNDAVAALERDRAGARARLDEARQATEDRWDEVKRVSEDTVTRVQQAYDAAAAAMRR